MASVIAMAADKIVMKKGARMMIHEASAATHGDAAEHRNRAELLESISDEIAGIYSARTKLPQDEIRESMKKETWMDGKQAVALGFADENFDTEEKEKAKNIMSILDRLTSPSDAEAKSRIVDLESEITNRESQISELTARLQTAESALQEVAGEITALKATNQSLSETNESIRAELELHVAQAENLTEQAQVTEEKISVRAAELLASQGHQAPVNLQAETPSASETLFAQYRKLQSSDPVAAAKFWNENESEIIAGK
jgi:chromosome segregation ATPase